MVTTQQETPNHEDKTDEGIDQCDNNVNVEEDAKAVPTGASEEEGHVGSSSAIEEDDDEEMDHSFISIRSQDDGIFEQDDDVAEDDDEEEFYNFVIPEVILSSPPSRKRKQEMRFIDTDLSDLIELSAHVSGHQEEEPKFRIRDEAGFKSTSAELYKVKKQERIPLYLLNPEDFEGDPKKQYQIRRAIITYRHHQDKKQHIIDLSDENKKLREHVKTLKSKIIELSTCGCKKNLTANVDVLDVEISTVPTRMYVRSRKPNSLSQVFSQVEATSASVRLPPATSSSPKNVFTAPTNTLSADMTKPLINITSSRLADFNSRTLSSNNVVTRTLPKPLASKIFNKRIDSSLQGLQMSSSGATRISITEGEGNEKGFIPLSLATSIKSEPGVSSNMVTNATNSQLSTTATAPIPNAIKYSTVTPAAAPSVSRIVFAKKGNVSNAVQTASQLLFGTKTNSEMLNSIMSKTPVQTLTASELVFANRNYNMMETTTATMTNPLTSINNRRIAAQPSQIFQTASGQVLSLVQPPAPVSRKIYNPVQWKPIAPKPATPACVNSAPVANQQCTKEDIEEMWRRFDVDNDEDEMAMIAAISGTSPPQRNRKQTMKSRPTTTTTTTTVDQKKGNASSNNFLNFCEQVIELDKYQDPVFDEAD